MSIVDASTPIQRNGKARPAPAARRANIRLRKQASTLSRDVGALGRAAADVAQEKVESLRRSVANHTDQGRETVHELERTIERYIQERPLKTLLIAAGVGLLVGRFCMRR